MTVGCRTVLLLVSFLLPTCSSAWAHAIRVLTGATSLQGASLSPDGRRVVYDVALLPGHSLTTVGEMTVQEVTSTASRKVIGEGEQPKWSPTRDEIAFVLTKSLWACDSEGLGRRMIYGGRSRSSGEGETCTEVTRATWSPDGNQLAFVLSDCTETGERQIWVADRQGQQSHRLVGNLWPVSDIAWSPTSPLLAFIEKSPSRVNFVKTLRVDSFNVQTLLDSQKDTDTIVSYMHTIVFSGNGELLAAVYGPFGNGWHTSVLAIPSDGLLRSFLDQGQLRAFGADLRGGTVVQFEIARQAPRMMLGEFRGQSSFDVWVIDLPRDLVGLTSSQPPPKTKFGKKK